MQFRAEYSTLMDLFVQLVESQRGRKIETGREWLDNAQVLSKKLYNHLASMKLLAQGTSIAMQGTPRVAYIDHASVQVVARAALETYLVFFYIYGTNDESLSLFRHNTWHLAGLIDRQKYGALTEGAREAMAREKDVIQRLRAEITQSAHVGGFSQPQRRQLLKGIWRVGNSWKDLGVQADFHGRYFENIYNYFCGYSHSSYASALQMRDAQALEDQQMRTQTTLYLRLILMAHFSLVYTRAFPDANAVLFFPSKYIRS